MPFKGTRHGNGVADGAVAKRLLLWQHASALWRHAVWIRIVTSHNAWMGYEYSLQNIHSQTWPSPPRNNGACVINSFVNWAIGKQSKLCITGHFWGGINIDQWIGRFPAQMTRSVSISRLYICNVLSKATCGHKFLNTCGHRSAVPFFLFIFGLPTLPCYCVTHDLECIII